jgi:hypothetical protein
LVGEAGAVLDAGILVRAVFESADGAGVVADVAGGEGGDDDYALVGGLASRGEEMWVDPPDAGELSSNAKLNADFAAVIHADGLEGFVVGADINKIASAEARGDRWAG